MTHRITWTDLERALAAPHHNRPQVYIFTLDSHDCYGPFSTETVAHNYAKAHGLTCYQLQTGSKS